MEFTNFWNNYSFAVDYYVGAPLTQAMVDQVESETGYKLPASYINLLQSQNGGAPFKCNIRTKEPNSWSHNRVSIVGILGIDPDQSNSVIGQTGTAFMVEEWGYPQIGLYICDTPTAGHHIVMLDYRECGKQGEPKVVFVDQENDYKVTVIANDFASFLAALEPDEAFEEGDKVIDEALAKLETLSYAVPWKNLLSAAQFEFAGVLFKKIIASSIVANDGKVIVEGGSFVLFDFCAQVVFDSHKVKSSEELISLLRAAAIEDWTGPEFFEAILNWWNQMIAEKKIVKGFWGGYRFSELAISELKKQLHYY